MANNKLWGGRFKGQSSHEMDEFASSIQFDYLMFNEDIQGSLAHAKMLGEKKIIGSKDYELIRDGLLAIQTDYQNGSFQFDLANEDIHMNIEKILTDKIGKIAGKLHTARSRNDQVATDFHLYLKGKLIDIDNLLTNLKNVLLKLANDNVETIMPGYTHLQHAQPISLGHHLLAYYEMFNRDQERFSFNLKHTDISPLGAGAMAGTTFPIDRFMTAKELGFSKVYNNSIDAVSDRDFALEFLSNASILMMHLSRFCEELSLWMSYEFQFIELSDTYTTGSSIMPQKKNPDLVELIRGKTGRTYGNLNMLLVVMKGLPLAYNKDLQEDKEGVFDTVKTVSSSLKLFTEMISTMKVNQTNMYQSTLQDFSNATELADYLASKGMPFRDAHQLVGNLVYECIQKKISLQDLPIDYLQSKSDLIEEDVYEVLKSETAVARRNSYGGTGFDQVKKQIQNKMK